MLLLLSAACGKGTPTADPSVIQTQVAFSVLATAQAEALAQPQPTALPTQEPEPTEPPPAATFTATVSPYAEGSVSRASIDPVAGWGPADVYESFDGDSGIFVARQGDNYEGKYEGGRYHISFASRGWWTWFWGDVLFSEFYQEVLVINGDACVDADAAGILFLGDLDSDAGYLFGVTCGGEYFIGGTGTAGPGGDVCVPDHSIALDWQCDPDVVALTVTESEYIDPGPGAINRLGVMYKGLRIDLYINGHLVEGFDNFMLSHPLGDWRNGYTALYLHPGQRDLSTASFDEFRAWINP
jgi:hypothetical protein